MGREHPKVRQELTIPDMVTESSLSPKNRIWCIPTRDCANSFLSYIDFHSSKLDTSRATRGLAISTFLVSVKTCVASIHL